MSSHHKEKETKTNSIHNKNVKTVLGQKNASTANRSFQFSLPLTESQNTLPVAIAYNNAGAFIGMRCAVISSSNSEILHPVHCIIVAWSLDAVGLLAIEVEVWLVHTRISGSALVEVLDRVVHVQISVIVVVLGIRVSVLLNITSSTCTFGRRFCVNGSLTSHGKVGAVLLPIFRHFAA